MIVKSPHLTVGNHTCGINIDAPHVGSLVTKCLYFVESTKCFLLAPFLAQSGPSKPYRRLVEVKLRSAFHKHFVSFAHSHPVLLYNFRNINSPIYQAALKIWEDGHHHQEPPPFPRESFLSNSPWPYSLFFLRFRRCSFGDKSYFLNQTILRSCRSRSRSRKFMNSAYVATNDNPGYVRRNIVYALLPFVCTKVFGWREASEEGAKLTHV